MASVKYHGEFPADKDSIVQEGVTFERGKSVNVTDKDALTRLARNRYFEVSGESDKAEIDTARAEAEAAETETLRAWLDENHVPVRANASLATMQKAREDHEAAVAKAQAE